MRRLDPESSLDRALRDLPMPRAPLTLLPRVMTAVRMWSQRPWYARGWFTWPIAAQVAVLVALVTAVASGLRMLMLVDASGASLTPMFVHSWIGQTSSLLHGAQLAGAAAEAIWRSLIRPFMPLAFVFIMLMSLTCAALGVALARVTSGRAFQL